MTNVAFTAPHHQAAEVGLSVLKEGGSAVDAMIAAAATVAVVYPHMNSLGGDGFWLIQKPGKAPVAIDACGYAGSQATLAAYQESGIPDRGGRAAITLAGTVAGWHLARQWQGSRRCLPLQRLLEPAEQLARGGIKITESLVAASTKTFEALHGVTGFAETYLDQGKTLTAGNTLCNAKLADLIEHLYRSQLQLEDFYRGDIGQTLSRGLAAADSPITADDLAAYQAELVTPLMVTTGKGQLYNMVAPTQGVASLMILALYDRLYDASWSELQRVHHLVECTKQAFIVRDQLVCDRSRMSVAAQELLGEPRLQAMADAISPNRAAPWPKPAEPGDTVWMGALDADGTLVSFIQSIYWEFGSGLVLPGTGLVWNNRGVSFKLDGNHHNHLAPGIKPLHTLNPALAVLNDGRRFSYGTMGGEGQPQTQAALFARHIYHGLPLDEAIARDRWLLGRTWGETSTNLKMEQGLFDELAESMTAMGHEVAPVPSGSETMGHAGGIILAEDGSLQVATDPRSDGAALSAVV
ncbi:gamma-glutamyltransferase family protein [Halioxenophilus sp. WMMB6]|uniref:gamma-glutamyltransferase family protein n=1 Tax=Halioxenophilus sp. WMMB6 TaxID=3073815 RepID=UPI00295F170B|nr:gamma-glutamyltransferase [Halioxenophilus sp. WMMB6]